jgi:molybdate transport system substrate-binding protein
MRPIQAYRRSVRPAAFILVAGFVLSLGAAASRAQEATVFAAASLTNAMEELGKQWQQQSGQAVKFSFAASSAHARQVEQGAPADIFISADEQWMNWVAERNLIVPETRISALSNRLVMIVPADKPQKIDVRRGMDLAVLLGSQGKIATGDPAHVPVGRYAQTALTSLGLWGQAEPKLARAENVRAAMALVERGEAPIGIVYATDAAVNEKVRVTGVFPTDSHEPISYPFAIVRGKDTPASRQLFGFLTGTKAQPTYEKFGFLLTAK